MSSNGPPSDPDTAPISGLGERKRAAIVLSVIAVAAVVLVIVMVAVLGSSDGSSGPHENANPPGPAVTVTGDESAPSAPSPQPDSTARSSTSTSASTSASGPRTGPVSCPTAAPCALPDDTGNLIGTLNTYRASHGLAAITGSVTPAAKMCAVSSGDVCPSGFFWEPIGRSGQQMIDKIAGSSKGSGFLLDPNLKVVQVGWAYIPSSRSFECAVVSHA